MRVTITAQDGRYQVLSSVKTITQDGCITSFHLENGELLKKYNDKVAKQYSEMLGHNNSRIAQCPFFLSNAWGVQSVEFH